jgi:hypothetical protein
MFGVEHRTRSRADQCFWVLLLQNDLFLFLPKLFPSAFSAKTNLPIYRKSFAFMKKKGGRAAVPTSAAVPALPPDPG